MGKTKRKTLPPEAVRSCTVTTKMTAAERRKIREIAARYNLTPSDYMRHRALGYEPPSALTAEESAMLRNLDGCRVDILNFANALAGESGIEIDAAMQDIPLAKVIKDYHALILGRGDYLPLSSQAMPGMTTRFSAYLPQAASASYSATGLKPQR